MSTFGSETIPMTILGSNVYQTRWRTHYYKCPIVIGFMYGGNPLYNNTTQVGGIMYLQKTQGNGQYNYDTIQSNKIDFKMGHKFEPIPRKGDRYEKAWGYELWIVNHDAYCGKLLVFEKDKKFSNIL